MQNSLAAAFNDGKAHLLLAASGSVATIKLPNMIQSLSHHPNLSIRVILTASAKHFLAGQSKEQPTVSSLLHLPNVDAVYDDASEWGPEPWRRGAEVLHIQLRKWADILVIAPLSANTLAKVVAGMADNLLTSVVRAWDTTGKIDGVHKKILVAPAMNTAMYLHPITAQQVRVLEEEWDWFEVLPPQQQKTLACGDIGSGAMKEWTQIVKVVEERMGLGNTEAKTNGC
jgi:phosphopantothenoylcysteine decarboxylase